MIVINQHSEDPRGCSCDLCKQRELEDAKQTPVRLVPRRVPMPAVILPKTA
jgi:hypothetical protein